MGRYLELFEQAARMHIPLEASIELLHACNYACRHCYVPDLGAPARLPTARVMRLLEELAELGTIRVSFTGGEALLHPDWHALGRRARQLGFVLTVLTNGSPITPAVADDLAELDAIVHVSLYSLDPAAFDDLTRRRGSLERTLAGIELLRQRGCEVVLKVPLLEPTAASLDAIVAFAAEIGAACQPYPLVTPRQDGDLAPLALRLGRDKLRAFLAGPHAPRLPEQCRPVSEDVALCAAGSRYLAVTPRGDVLACLDLPRPAGNVLHQPLRAIWETSPWLLRLRRLRRADLRVCDACPKLSSCGRCHALALFEDGDLLGPSSWACQRAEIADELRVEREP